jgi:hypothetical protein
VLGLLLASLALALSAALAVRAADWPISWPTLVAYLAAITLFLLALAFAFWGYACSSLRYVIDANGLLIRWGLLRHFIPIDRIEKLTPGRGEHQPRIRGLSWWGYHIGRGVTQSLGEVLFFSTHRSPEEVAYVQTATATYGLSPQDPTRFVEEVRRFQQRGRVRTDVEEPRESVQRHPLAAHPVWSDRIAQGLLGLGIVLNLGLFAWVFAVYPDLDARIEIAFLPDGDAPLVPKRELLKIPATALALLAVTAAAALGWQRWERVGAYLLLSGAVFLQFLFWVALAIALVNA